MSRSKTRVLDEYLVLSAQMGEHAAFDLLAERWAPKLLRHALRMLGDGEQARDAAQDAWVEIARSLPRLHDEKAFPAWAYRIVTRRCARLIGGLQRERALKAECASEALVLADGYDAEPFEEQGLSRALQALPSEQQVAVALFYGEDMRLSEIAVALDVPLGTVKTRLMHARQKLRAALQGDDDG